MKNKVIFFILIFTIISLFFLVQRNNKRSEPVNSSAAPPIITPVQIETTNVMDSPDGSLTLILEEKNGLQSLFVTTIPNGQKVQIYKKETAGHKLEIPYNSWSPDNIYFFLKEKTPAINNYLVFQSSGNIFASDSPYLSVQELFRNKVPNYAIEDITGWAAPNLLLINARMITEDKKASFWFEVSSQLFIQLGTYFK